jgi:hypothetical protein
MRLSKIALSAIVGLSSAAFAQSKSGRPDVYTTSVFKAKADVPFESAKKAFDGLNAVLSKTKGFEKRNLFFDKEQMLWIDQIKWKHADVAKSGIKSIETDPAYAEVKKVFEGKPMAIYHAERVSELDGPK